jgi:hypothetical protein
LRLPWLPFELVTLLWALLFDIAVHVGATLYLVLFLMGD